MEGPPRKGSEIVELIDRLVAEIHDQTGAVDGILLRLSGEEQARRPTPGRWSVAEHLRHMALTCQEYLDVIEPAIERARAKGWSDSGVLRKSWVGQQFLKQMSPPVKMRLPTFSRIRPSEGIPGEEARLSFSSQQERLLSVLDGARDVDIGRVRIRSPFLALLRMTAAEGFQVVVVHNRRHLWSITRILAQVSGHPDGGAAQGGVSGAPRQRDPVDS